MSAFGAASVASAADCTTAKVLSGSAFEIDTNANLKVDGASPCIDWLSGGSGTGLRSGVISKDDKPTGAGDDSFGQGTAENDANPTIVDGSIPPNKSDLKKFGVFTETAATGKFLELFWARVQNPSGTTNMDFELNQKFCDLSATPTNCADNGKNFPAETPLRTAGDKLITYDLSRGGTVPTISIRTWNGTVWGPATVITGGANPLALGAVNTTGIPALESGGTGTLDAFTFGEAAINFNAIFTGGECGAFGSVYLKSRSSDSFTSEIKDFVGPQHVNITNCTSITTNATAAVTIGSPISDTATLSGATAGAGGTITFHLYSDSQCANEVTTGLTPKPVNGNGDYNSGNFTPTAVGTYYWIAVYSGDAGNAGGTTACRDANESSVVSKALPSVVTHAAGPVTVGSPITDTATLSNATSDAGGTITFKLYSDAQCQTTALFTSVIPVSGNGDYTSGAFTPTAAGSYNWTADYSGDAKNSATASLCGAVNETSVVEKIQPGIVTSATAQVVIGSPISDTATLSGATSNASGTITFHLYSDPLCANEVTTGLTPKTVTGNGDYNSGNFTPTAVGSYYWTASYSGDANNKSVDTACGDLGETSVVTKAPSSIETAQELFPQDAATISATAGGTPTGSVTFALFAPADAMCDGPAVYSQTVALTGGAAATSNTTFSVKTASLSTYRWRVTYGGDAKHDGVTSACGTEQFTLTIANG